MCICIHMHIHILAIMSSCQYFHFQSIPTGSYLPSSISYLYVPTSTMRTLAPNNTNTDAHLLHRIVYLKLFQNTIALQKQAIVGDLFAILLLPPSLCCGFFCLKCKWLHLSPFSFRPHSFHSYWFKFFEFVKQWYVSEKENYTKKICSEKYHSLLCPFNSIPQPQSNVVNQIDYFLVFPSCCYYCFINQSKCMFYFAPFFLQKR